MNVFLQYVIIEMEYNFSYNWCTFKRIVIIIVRYYSLQRISYSLYLLLKMSTICWNWHLMTFMVQLGFELNFLYVFSLFLISSFFVQLQQGNGKVNIRRMFRKNGERSDMRTKAYDMTQIFYRVSLPTLVLAWKEEFILEPILSVYTSITTMYSVFSVVISYVYSMLWSDTWLVPIAHNIMQ